MQDIKNVFGLPQVTHWRPIHNLFFLIAGNIFDKNYVGYHLLTFLFQIGSGFLIYKVVRMLTRDHKSGLIAGLIYTIHPAHFISLFWISGSATVIGFFFLVTSFYCYFVDRKIASLILYVISLLASEAMVVGLAIFTSYEFLFKKEKTDKFLLTITGIMSVIFLIIRFVFFTPKVTIDVYQLELSAKVLNAIKYYLLRTAGFAEASGDKIVSLILFGWLTLIILLLFKSLNKKQNINLLIFSIVTIIAGFSPFILIPSHLSPHYMNVSIFGFAIIIGLALKQLRPVTSFVFLLIFLGISIYNINLTKSNNWVFKRADLAKAYVEQIEKENSLPESKLVFADNKMSTSQEAYIALGTGEAIKFWFKDKNYRMCFTFFENCDYSQNKIFILD